MSQQTPEETLYPSVRDYSLSKSEFAELANQASSSGHIEAGKKMKINMEYVFGGVAVSGLVALLAYCLLHTVSPVPAAPQTPVPRFGSLPILDAIRGQQTIKRRLDGSLYWE